MSPSGYQTIVYPDGSKISGAFDTPSIFSEVSKFVQFHDSSVLDLGCNNGMYGILACNQGAKKYFGIDCIPSFIQFDGNIKNF